MYLPQHASERVAVDADRPFNGVKVFSATMSTERERLTDTVTAWLTARPRLAVTQMVVTRSNDAAFHCVAITVFYWDPDDRAMS